MIRTLTLFSMLSLGGALAATTALAQVAMTEGTPAAPRYLATDVLGFNGATVTPDNPAAIQWETRSRIAVGSIGLDQTNPPGPTVEYSGFFGGYRGHLDDWAVAVEHLAVDRDDGGSFEERNTTGQLSFEVTDYFSVGAGLGQASADYGVSNSDLETNVIGASINTGRGFFFGYAVGREKYEDSLGNTGGRDTSLLGVAVRTKGSWRWHLAYDELKKEHYEGLFFGGFDATLLTAQVNVGNLLLGAQMIDLDRRDSERSLEGRVIDIGWAPENGLTLTARITDSETVDAGAVVQEGDGLSFILTAPF